MAATTVVCHDRGLFEHRQLCRRGQHRQSGLGLLRQRRPID